MDAAQVAELKGFINECKSDPSILHDPSLLFFKSYLQSLGAKLPREVKSEAGEAEMSGSDERRDVDDDDIVESDIELDNADVVEADNDPPQKMGNFTSPLTDESRDAAQEEKSKAMDALSEGRLSEAVEHLTEAVLLNPVSAILYASRGSVYVKMKKPNAAIRDANAALEVNPDSAKAYKVRGMAKALLGQWEEAASDLHVASKLDYDEEIGVYLKKVESNVNKIKEHHKKYDRLRKERDLRNAERVKKRQAEALEREALSALKEGKCVYFPDQDLIYLLCKQKERRFFASNKLYRNHSDRFIYLQIVLYRCSAIVVMVSYGFTVSLVPNDPDSTHNRWFMKSGQVMGIHSTSELETKLNAATKASRLAVLYFTATWCGPCRFISPHFTSLAEKYPKVVFLKADIDEARDVAGRWNVSSVPAFFFVKKGKEIDKVVGADKNGLEKKLLQHAV